MRGGAGQAPLSRLLRLLLALQANRCPNAGVLAALCEVSRRTIYRDLDALSAAGIPVRFVAERRGYQLAPGYAFQPPGLDSREAAALVLLAQAGGPGDGFGLYRSAREGARKLVAVLAGEARDHVGALAELIHVRREGFALESTRQAVYDAILQSLTSRVQVRLAYIEPGSSSEYSTKVSPYRLLLDGRSCHLIGRSTLHREVRVFRLPWVQRAELTSDAYEIPAQFDLERFLGHAWRVVHGRERVKLWLRFSRSVAPEVADGDWHASQRFEPQADGSIDLHLNVDGLDEILGWVIAFGDQVEVLEPDALRVKVREMAARMAKLNGPHPQPATPLSIGQLT
ncbi:MAG TPA: transcriptional regulator [Isosphaeraceae bacterium]|jgi:predicted DNA-binding transcriptional regulator YafY|nr:transcriptional regulator [Isosphaeraceae bacterium]